jgi:hypothetical protein
LIAYCHQPKKPSWNREFYRLYLGFAGINLKTLLDKVFRLFSPQKVLTIGVIAGKIQGLFP